MRRNRDDRRSAVAHLAARMLAEGTALDFQSARRKAAERIGVRNTSDLPDNRDLQQALLDQQNLFDGERHADRQRELRRQALEAMDFLAAFHPCLVGPVLNGTACDHSAVTLHLFTDESEAIMRRLLDAGIRFESLQRRLRMTSDRHQEFPGFRVRLGNDESGTADIELIVFPNRQRHVAPLSSVDGKPMQRADIQRLRELLATAAG